MADASPWWEQLGDTVGFPGVAAAGYGAAKAVPPILRGLGSYGASALGGLAAAPGTAALPFLYAMGDLKGHFTTAANGGEQPLYIRDATGRMVPNPNNPMARPLTQQQQPQAHVQPQIAAQTPPPPPQLPPPTSQAPMQSPIAAAMANVPLPQSRPQIPPPQSRPQMPMSIAPPAAAAPVAPSPNYYNGPGSLNYSPFTAAGAGTPMFGGNANSTSLIQKFMNALHGGSLPQMAQQMGQSQPQYAQQDQQRPMGLFPKLAADFHNFGSMFGGGGTSGGTGLNLTGTGGLY